MDDDFRPSSTLPHSHIHPHHPSHAHPPPAGGLNNSGALFTNELAKFVQFQE